MRQEPAPTRSLRAVTASVVAGRSVEASVVVVGSAGAPTAPAPRDAIGSLYLDEIPAAAAAAEGLEPLSASGSGGGGAEAAATLAQETWISETLTAGDASPFLLGVLQPQRRSDGCESGGGGDQEGENGRGVQGRSGRGRRCGSRSSRLPGPPLPQGPSPVRGGSSSTSWRAPTAAASRPHRRWRRRRVARRCGEWRARSPTSSKPTCSSSPTGPKPAKPRQRSRPGGGPPVKARGSSPTGRCRRCP